jgi:dynein assembly factor 5
MENVRYILRKTLDPAKEAQLRTRFLLLIPELFLTTNNFITSNFDVVINEFILPNIVWKAGRAASSVRMTACASLVLVLQQDQTKNLQPKQEILDELAKTILTCLDDDNKSTRLYACNIFLNILCNYGQSYDNDKLHRLYPEFIKRLDDQSDDIRHEIIKVFNRYYTCLNTNNNGAYDKVLYQAHLQTIFENLILYLDDSNLDIQSKIFGKLILFCKGFKRTLSLIY